MKSSTSRAAAAVLLGAGATLGFASCAEKAPKRRETASPEPSTSAALAPRKKLQARAFCDLVYGANGKKLEASCPGPAATTLKYAGESCLRELEASTTDGALELDELAATACAERVAAVFAEGVPARSALDLTALGCEGLFEGKLSEGQVCKTTLACRAPLVCGDAKCVKPAAAGAKCSPGDEGLTLAARSDCDDESYCPGDPRPRGGSMWGDEIGDAFGIGGLGLSGVGEGGGRGEGIGLGNLGTGTGRGYGGSGRLTSHKAKPPRVRMGATSVSGRLPPEVIQRIVRQNFGRFRLCYENGLRTKPDLEGTVKVGFVIGRDGSVSAVTNNGSTLPDSAVVACVVRSFAGLSFPEPEGGVVKVTYPISFSPGDDPPAKPGGAPPQPSGSPSAVSPPAPSASASAPPAAAAVGAWDGEAPQKGMCTKRAPKGGACLESDGCSRGLSCVARVCTDAAGPKSCQSGSDCAAIETCGEEEAGVKQPPKVGVGMCRARGAVGAACKSNSQCTGRCSSGVCAAACANPPGK